MVHSVPARKEAKSLKKKAVDLKGEAKALEGIVGAETLAEDKATQASRLLQEAEYLKDQARLEDITVRQEPLVKQTKKGGRKEYLRWVAAWREGGRYRKVYLGSCKKMGQGEALQKARAMKAKALGFY